MNNIELAIKEIEQQAKDLKARDFRNGAWQVPANQLKSRQSQFRALKFQIQLLEEAQRSKDGSMVEKYNLLPLVLRREFLQGLPTSDAAGVRPNPDRLDLGNLPTDGELFTFAETEYVEVEAPHCGCGAVDADVNTENEIIAHLEAGCKTQITQKFQAERYQNRHVIGSWLCRGCLLANEITFGSEEAKLNQDPIGLGFNPQREIVWCPNFKTTYGYLGPVKYAIQQREDQASIVCYAGLLHSQHNVGPDYSEQICVCDTCGYRKSRRWHSVEAVRPGTTIVDGIDSDQAAEVIQALNAPPVVQGE